jgi:hypothetical protein
MKGDTAAACEQIKDMCCVLLLLENGVMTNPLDAATGADDRRILYG